MAESAESALRRIEPSTCVAAYDGPIEEDSVRNFAADYDGPEDAHFPGCVPIAMTVEQFERYDGRVEYWSAEHRTAWICCDGGPDHEGPGGYLPSLVTRIALERGSPIRCWGALRIATVDAAGRSRESMHPDQSIYLNPGIWTPNGVRTQVGRDPRPDVVLEVDNTTDVRRNKLGVYAEWRFPEVWVETPDAPTPSRPRGLRSRVTIYVLDGDDYVERTESKALPSWRATEIHQALNEPVPSAGTIKDLVRVGRILGDAEGTGPRDDEQIAGYMRRAHEVGQNIGFAQGREAGRESGVAEGRRRGLADAAMALLRSRGVEVSDDFEERLAASTVAPETLLASAAHATSASDFWRRLQNRQ